MLQIGSKNQNMKKERFLVGTIPSSLAHRSCQRVCLQMFPQKIEKSLRSSLIVQFFFVLSTPILPTSNHRRDNGPWTEE